MSTMLNAGDTLAGRYRLADLLHETGSGRFWRARDTVLDRDVAVHVVSHDDPVAEALLEAARTAAPLHDPRVLRVLDAHGRADVTYVVNEWGLGRSLDDVLTTDGPLAPRQAAWIVAEVADSLAAAHAAGLAHGRLNPENVLIDHHGHVRIIGFGVDAALHGLPPGRTQVDMADLVSLLYASLTGKWPGVSPSRLPSAPIDHGAALRPRRVRAGIPRVLDGLCEELLNPTAPSRTSGQHGHDCSTARGVSDYLHEFVGGAGDVLEISPMPSSVAVPLGPLPAPSWQEGPSATSAPTEAVALPPTPAPAPAPPAPEPEPEPDLPREPVDVPTEAGLPVFDDVTDDVSWLRARSEPPPPPPELEPVEERPLFAPDPPDGQPVRRPRPGAPVPKAGYWPWDEPGDPTHSGDTGTGRHPRSDDTMTGTGAQVPGRNWFRLAVVIAVAVLVLLISMVAFQMGRGPAPERSGGTGTTTKQEPAGDPVALENLRVTDFDPEGDPPTEYPELVPLAIDGNPATAWNTQTYNANFGLANSLKNGVGLVVALDAAELVREVSVTVEGTTSFSVYVTDDKPTTVDGLEPDAEATGDGTVDVELSDKTGGRYVLIWLTSLPQQSDGFRGVVSEVVVRG